MGMISTKKGLIEGDVIFKYHQARFDANKNFIGTVLGPTGSGKSYTALKICEIEYQRRFKEPFPKENICFSIEEVIRRIEKIKEKGRKGEVILGDDFGAAGYGALEFQSKTSKLFSYILQSFRSLNIGLILTLPVLTMLNKQGRQLMHYQMVTCGIDHETKTAKVKPYFHQLNQSTGKSYWKFMRMMVGNKVRTIKRLNYTLADENLREEYEKKKESFLKALTRSSLMEIDKANGVKPMRIPSEKAFFAEKMRLNNFTDKEISEKIGVCDRQIRTYLKEVREFRENSKKQIAKGLND